MKLAASIAVGRAELSLPAQRSWNQKVLLFAAMWLALLSALPAWAQTVGQLRVVVTDDSSDELPIAGAAVALSCQALIGGSQERIGDGNGEVLFTELPPGLCKVVVTKAGLRGVTVDNIQVNVNRTTMQYVKLRAGTAEMVTIITKQKAVDVSSTATGKVIAQDFLHRIPANRTYQTAVQTVSGVTGRNPNMAGASINENTYMLDGANITAQPGNTESYTHPGHGPLVMADQDRFSTFAIDVDTASYALARAKLSSGVLPVADGVRVEEFVNAFHYRWDPPTGGQPLGIHMEAAPHPSRSDRVLLSVALQGEVQTVERPVRLTFLVDVSGSMASYDKLPLAQQSLHTLVDGLGAEDRVSLVTYAGHTGIALQPSWTVNKAPIHTAIDALSSGGGTAMGAGIELAYQMASKMYVEGAENRVVILTDGDANVGQSSTEGLMNLVDRWAGDGIMLSVVGFGQGNYKDALLEQIADKGDGNYHYVDTQAEADRVFGRDLASNLVTVARDVKVQIEFPTDSVIAWRQIGYENRAVADEDFRNDTVDGGEVGAGHQVTALYELVLRDHPTGELARVQVRAEPPGKEAKAIEFGTTIGSSELAETFTSASSDLRFAVGVAMFAELLRRSPHVAEVSFADVLDILDGAIDTGDTDQQELRNLVIRAAELSGGLQATVIPDPVLPPATHRASR